LEHVLALVGDLVVPEADDTNASCGEPLATAIIMGGAIEMPASVNFDTQARTRTIEVEHVWSDRVLTSKPMSAETVAA
jgi:hypothetical protein